MHWRAGTDHGAKSSVNFIIMNAGKPASIYSCLCFLGVSVSWLVVDHLVSCGVSVINNLKRIGKLRSGGDDDDIVKSCKYSVATNNENTFLIKVCSNSAIL